ncbi:DnaJ protein, putative [Plasmodium chabaudi chabaudi]|uniref:DnaJ protein, putative n=1 Tax=Plasmodium chabaudi chabaudi TaxID=31271 RepID=A0A4V0K8N2_PLACU|nr:DnaJ protein, putative [Plasmodium chabaudi chabaudi]VTZ69489.1 DnaJ protein, putative [Plasmodium chabaudi chabaudi]|eukprot:XP_738570.2 DnaJ protein, putative [Plasmodium chabaudi chabaudi]
MKKTNKTGNLSLKNNNDNNALNKCPNYFNINKIKELYNFQNDHDYEKIFNISEKNTLGTRKRNKISEGNDISLSKSGNNIVIQNKKIDDATKSARITKGNRTNSSENIANEFPHSNELQASMSQQTFTNFNCPKIKKSQSNKENNLQTVHKNKKIKLNNVYDESYFFNNSLDKTPTKNMTNNNIDTHDQIYIKRTSKKNIQRNKNNDSATSPNNILNKYDFIRYICSPTKIACNDNNEQNKCNISNKQKDVTDLQKIQYYNKNRKIAHTENVTNSDSNAQIINNNNKNKNTPYYIQTENNIPNKLPDPTTCYNKYKNHMPIDLTIDIPKNSLDEINSDIESKTPTKKYSNTDQDDFQDSNKRTPIDLNSAESINRLKKNFFINSKKFFINDFKIDDTKDKAKNTEQSQPPHDCNNIEGINYNSENLKYVGKEDNTTNSNDNNEQNCDDDSHDEQYYFGYANKFKQNKKKSYNISKSLYSYLDLSYNCSKDEIKKAYKDKIKIHHPDKGGDIKQFLEIKLSYDILIDEKKRKMYDKYGNTILELLMSENFNDYNISSDEKNCETEKDDEENEEKGEDIDDESLRIYDLFVQKYNNVSYLHNRGSLKINSKQYNQFQKLVYHFFNNQQNCIFKNIFYIYPIYSKNMPPFSKSDAYNSNNKKKKNKKYTNINDSRNSTNSFDESHAEYDNDYGSINKSSEHIEDNSKDDYTQSNDSLFENSSYSDIGKEITINDIIKKKKRINIFEELTSQFNKFYNDTIIQKTNNSEQFIDTSKNLHHKIPPDHTNKPFETQNNDATTFMKDDISKDVDGTHNPNDGYEDKYNFFKDIQVSPIKYKVINESTDKDADCFYKWFDFFFKNDNTSPQKNIYTNQTSLSSKNKPNKTKYFNTQKEGIIFQNNNPYHLNNTHTNKPTEYTPSKNNPNIFQFVSQNNQFSPDAYKYEYPYNYSCSINKCDNTNYPNSNKENVNPHSYHNNSPINSYCQYISDYKNENLQKPIFYSNPCYNNMYPKVSSPNLYTPIKISDKKSTQNCDNIPITYSCEKKKDDILINIEEKYGFNLLKKNEQKIKDMTYDFNYIYVGHNVKKKKRFLLFIKEESIKNFLKIKLLIHKIKNKSNLKHISLFQKEIDKIIKNIEYILLFVTCKDELIPLTDFYLLDKNVYSKEHYCIPLHIKKNSIILRPAYFHLKWVIYTLQSFILFNLFFQKINKYMCSFPFFNYKYNYFKNFIISEQQTEQDSIPNTYIFFHNHIIKNKHKYIKYFPHKVSLYLKKLEPITPSNVKHIQINLSPLFVLTPYKNFDLTEY